MIPPDLSIIIPTLNEEQSLPLLLADLGRQQGVMLEVIVVDGGSTDTTCQLAAAAFAAGSLVGTCRTARCGRGVQMNAGAATAQAEWLLFLHADCRLPEESLLQTALGFMRAHRRRMATNTLAGHFPLHFDTAEGGSSFGFYFYEVKTALGRPGCIHGDQGLLLSKDFFGKVGPFREDLPIMEDTALADIIGCQGRWLLLPGVLVTSARRFHAEGFKARQTLNAMMMTCYAIGWLDFFARAPGIYRQQDRTQPLQTLPFFLLVKELLDELPRRRRWSTWLAIGAYVRSQAWQIGLALDCRRAYRRGCRQVPASLPWLRFFDRWLDPMTNHIVGRALTAVMVRGWLAWQLLSARR